MKNAFVSGGAEGQGHLLARKLAARGWQVFVGVLPNARSVGFADVPAIIPVQQDVSDPGSVAESAADVEAQLAGDGLHLLMNVAGVADIGSGVLENASDADLHRVFEINTFGQLRLVQAFLPALRRGAPDARIMNYGSGAIIVSPPGAGVYNMSKHAVHGMTLTLRNELGPLGIQVTTVLPGGVKTGMTANPFESTKAMWGRTRPELRAIYEPFLLNPTTQVLPKLLEEKGSTAEEATEAALKLLDIARWKSCYTVGKDAAMLKPLQKFLPEAWFEAMLRGTYKIPGLKQGWK
jgi:NAD(P)-dependent dehydrogenase (short-subunit alcohol dehydrogenase family)